MKQSKWCCRIFPIVLIIVSGILAAALWYFDEGVHEFRFLTDRNEFFNYLGTVLFIAVLPIGLFYLLNDKEKFRDKARSLALLGFLPTLAVLLFILL
jgi:predicted permease